MPLLRPFLLASVLTIAATATAMADTATVRVHAPFNARISYAITTPVIGEGPTILTIQIKPSRRHARTHRALFQTWTGFSKQYAGRKYPF